MPSRRNTRPSPSAVAIRVGTASSAMPMPAFGSGEAIKVEPWGANNLLPQEILKVVYDSGTAETCLDRLGQFIGGHGFADKNVGQAMANPRQTFNELLAEAKHYAAFGLGMALALRFTHGGTDPEVYCVETDCLRREKGGSRFVLNLELAKGNAPNAHNRIYLPYDPMATAEQLSEEVIAAAATGSYWGHLWFVFEKRVGRGLYPTPHYWAAKEDIESDAAVPRYDRKQIKNGFFPDAILTLIGEKYKDVDDESWVPGEGQTNDDRPYLKSPDRANIEKTVQALKGSDSESTIMLNIVESESEKPQIDFIDKGPNSKGLTDMTNRIEGKVYRRMGVPPVLCGVAEAGMLGSNQQIVNSIKLFNLVVAPRRALITDSLTRLFPGRDFAVAPLNPVDYVDPAVVGKMTDDELRALQGLPPLEKPQDTEAQQTLKALNGLSPLVATKVLNSMSADEIRALIGLLPVDAAGPTPLPAAP